MLDDEILKGKLTRYITRIVAQTNGITLDDTLDLMLSSNSAQNQGDLRAIIEDFHNQLMAFQNNRAGINGLINHPFSKGLYSFFKNFPIPYREEHSHLTGSLSAKFIYPRLMKKLDGPAGPAIRKQIEMVYGADSFPIESEADVDRLVRLKKTERFDRYLQILMLPKLILDTREAHAEAAYHMASELYNGFNVGYIRLKFTLSRATSDETEKVPGSETLTSEDIALGLYEGFQKFKSEQQAMGSDFEFILSPCFRKEADFYDASAYPDKQSHVLAQINEILDLLKRHPFLIPHLREVDTVGNERDFFKKSHFYDMQNGFRKLQYYGFQIRSHHGETWHNLRRGIQAVDNAMNIWHIDALEHGLSLGMNPNYYFHSMYQRILRWNHNGEGVRAGSLECNELKDMLWNGNTAVLEKLLRGERLNSSEETLFTKTKFHTASEVEHYQHDVLNRLIQKKVSLMSLPSSNYKLTSYFDDYKDHPFSWWEKKGMKLGVGTDNYVTLDTDFIKEMLILLYTDPVGLKITKLLMVTTGETRRPYISHLLWEMNR